MIIIIAISFFIYLFVLPSLIRSGTGFFFSFYLCIFLSIYPFVCPSSVVQGGITFSLYLCIASRFSSAIRSLSSFFSIVVSTMNVSVLLSIRTFINSSAYLTACLAG